MKKVFLAIIERLKNVQSLRFIDLDKGHLDNYETRPNVAFPAAVFDFDTNATTITENIQRVVGQLTVRAAFDYSGETSSNTPGEILSESLNYFDVIDAIKAALHGFTSKEIDYIEHTGTQTEGRGDGLNVKRISFEIGYEEMI